MKTTILIAVLALLAGCASNQTLRAGTPDVSLTSTKAPAVYGQCVAAGWGDFFGTSVNHAATGSSYTVSLPTAFGGTNGVMDARPSGGGAVVTASFRMGKTLGGYGKFERVMRACI